MNYIDEIRKRDKKRKELAREFLDESDEFAHGHYGLYDWSRNITHITNLNLNLPFFRTVEGKDHTLFVLDIDIFNVENLIKKIKFASVVAKYILDKFPVRWLIKFSGSSFHLIQRYNKRINPVAFYDVMCKMFEGDWRNEMEDSIDDTTRFFTKQFKLDGEIFTAGIDMTLTDRRHIISGLYSEYSKEEGLYSIPVSKDDLNNPMKILHNSRLQNLELNDYKIPPFMFHKWLGDYQEIPSQKETKKNINIRKSVSGSVKSLEVVKLEENDENNKHLKNMKELIDNTEYLCVKKAVEISKNHHGVFFPRSLIARYLYWNYSKDPDIIAYYFYHEINNDDDNKPENWKKMINGLNFSLRNKGEEKSMDTQRSKLIILNNLCDSRNCKKPCLRKSPLYQDSSNIKSNEDFKSVMIPCQKIIESGKNTIIKKTTRVGATTSTVLSALKNDKKILVLCPTNRIAEETFSTIAELAHRESINFNGCVVGSNTKLCLRCMQFVNSVRDKFKDQKFIAINHLPFLLKDKCRSKDGNCKYFDDIYIDGSVVKNGIKLPLINSQISPPKCGFSTIFHHIDFYNVIFITYNKLNILIQQMNKGILTSEIEKIINRLIVNFDIILLDEVSRFVNSPSMELCLYKKQKKLNENFEIINEEITVKNIINQIRNVNGSEREKWDALIKNAGKNPDNIFVNQILDIIERHFISIISDFKDTPSWGTIDNPISPYLREEINEKFNEWYSLFVKYAKKFNLYFKNILDVMSLVSQPVEKWYITNIPKDRETRNIRVKLEPFYNNIVNFIRDNHHRRNQILITDATMPYVQMSELFGIPFRNYQLGDPRNTCKLQMIIPDSKNVYPSQFLRNYDTNEIKERLISFIFDVSDTFGTENVMIVCPNKDIYYFLKKLHKDKKLPPNISLEQGKKQVTYYRSSATRGVSNERRIMITIGSPHPPKHSYLWMAEMLKNKNLFPDLKREELSNRLEVRESSSAFLQTIGRCKDPVTKVPSLVFCFGMNGYHVHKFINNIDTPQPIIHFNKNSDIKDTINVGTLWRKKRKNIDEEILNAINRAHSFKENKIYLDKINRRFHYIRNIIPEIPPDILSHFGIVYHKNSNMIEKFS